jgi:ADP-heptose:LPS heptosyltransferase
VGAGKVDERLGAQIKEALGKDAVNAVGRTTIRQLGALIENSSFYLGADTGPMHMAIALRVPTVGIFGPGNYPAYGTYGKGFEHFHPIWHQIKEFPWVRNKKVAGNPYMDAVTVDEVIQACRNQIERFSKTKSQKAS